MLRLRRGRRTSHLCCQRSTRMQRGLCLSTYLGLDFDEDDLLKNQMAKTLTLPTQATTWSRSWRRAKMSHGRHRHLHYDLLEET